MNDDGHGTVLYEIEDSPRPTTDPDVAFEASRNGKRVTAEVRA